MEFCYKREANKWRESIKCAQKCLFRGSKLKKKTESRKGNGFIYNYWAFNLKWTFETA